MTEILPGWRSPETNGTYSELLEPVEAGFKLVHVSQKAATLALIETMDIRPLIEGEELPEAA